MYNYRTKGTCSSNIELEVEDGIIKDIAFWGGCNGNLKAISKLVDGMTVEEIEQFIKDANVVAKKVAEKQPKMSCK